MSFPRYERYKESGVEWLGEVPEGWEVKPVKAVSTCNDEVLDDSTPADYEIEYVEISGVNADRGIVEMTTVTFGASPSRARRRVKDGDIIVSTVRTYLRAIAPVIKPAENVIVSTGFAVVRPRSVHSNFLGYLFRSEFMISGVIARSVGVSYPAINASELIRLKVPVPPLPEQQTIAAFLDCETGKIDELVAEQERLIGLLKEKRKAVISHTVTKGLNPDSPLKDSGIEWLGEVPEGWEVKRLKFLCDVQTGGKDTVNAVEDGEHPFFVRSQTVEHINSFSFDCEAVLTAGDGVGVGKVYHHYNGKFDFHQRVYMMNNFRFVTGKFFFCYLAAMFHKIALEGGAKSTVDSLRMPLFTNFEFAIPPLPEQHAIAAFLDTETAKIDTLVGEAQQAVSLLKERRSALISAAVTGKIDVRRWENQPPSFPPCQGGGLTALP